MAEVLLSIPLEIAMEKLAIFIEKQIRLIASASNDVHEIQDKFQLIKAIIMDAERKQFTDESVHVWLLKLKGVALDIEDVVEHWQISSVGNHDDNDEGVVESICLPLTHAHFMPSVIFSRRKIAVQVKEIRKRLDAIHGDELMSSFSSSSVGGETMPFSSHRPQTSSLVEESDIIGRDEDRETVIDWLVNDAFDGQQWQEVHVAAIVGVGGLGKTTLAQQIFNNPKVKDHFNQALYWVCVSDVFDEIKLTKAILEAVNLDANSSSLTQLDPLQKKLLESLKGKRFLLVLDDVWNDIPEKWETVRLSLKSGVQGSRILVTTRSKKVAGIMNASPRIHELKGLSDDLSWELFCRRAFPGKKPEEFSEFESIGRAIVNKCRGVPLAIKMMGGTMNEKTTMEDWENILNSEMWSLPEVKGRILPVLQISYYNLPSNLKQCFAYCSIYEKDTVMKKNELVSLWAAQGFIRTEGNRVIEDIGEGYFNGLAARSMFQEVHENYEGETVCKMHDLLHDLARVITEDESYIFTGSKQSNSQCSSISGVRHASLNLYGDDARNSLASCPAKKLRTLFVDTSSQITGVDDKLFLQARFLRVLVLRRCSKMEVLLKAIGKLKHLRFLDLSHSSIYKLPDALGKMKHLRYLDLSDTAIKKLPESMSHLVNLHTLNLDSCVLLKKLCRGMSKIVGLRHLYINNTWELNFLPKGIGKLTSLQSLCKFIVGGDKGEYCGIDELQELNSIRGSLKIEGLDRVSDAEQAVRAQLCKKQYVRKLVLDISSGERGAEDDKEEERIRVLECLRPHPNLLQHLSLKGDSISKLTLPSWMGDPSFSNLTQLVIAGFSKWEPNNTMPGLGKLPGLKWLEIKGVGVRKLGDEFYYGNEMISGSNDGVGKGRGVAFPKLKSLTLEHMEELEEWELTWEADASRVMPSLRELKVFECPKLQQLPSHLAIATSPAPATSSSSEVLEESENYCVDELIPLPPDHLLKPLEVLEIYSCKKLQSLPHSLGQLKKLQRLEIRGDATELTCLPNSLGQLESLENLTINYCRNLKSLPDSLGGLKKLKGLTIQGLEKLKSLPDSLGQLESLEHLNIQYCRELESLPDSLGGLKKLKYLEIEGLEKLKSLPDSLGQLESLENLQIQYCRELESLPNSLGGLKKLKSLSLITLEKLKSLPNSLGQLESLEYLYIDICHNLESLPDYLGGLKKLETLIISRLEMLKSLPDSLGQLESLKHLYILAFHNLESLTDSLGGLKNLKSLAISELETLKSLPDSLGQLESLERLGIFACRNLESLPHSLAQLASLDYLEIQRCDKLKSLLLPSLGRLQKFKNGVFMIVPNYHIERKGRREDLPDYISHIKTIEIDSKRF